MTKEILEVTLGSTFLGQFYRDGMTPRVVSVAGGVGGHVDDGGGGGVGSGDGLSRRLS